MSAMPLPAPRRGEIWTANLGERRERHWVLIVSLDGRNLSDRIDSVLVVPFSSRAAQAPTILPLVPRETGLPDTSYLRGHFISILPKQRLLERQQRNLSPRRMRQVVTIIRRSFDPDAPYDAEPQ